MESERGVHGGFGEGACDGLGTDDIPVKQPREVGET